MEAPQRGGIPNKEKRNNTLGGGAPIAGLIVVGGALAVTGLIAVASFVTNRHKNKASPQQSHHASQHDNACHETSNATKDQVLSCESLPSQTLILEEKPGLQVESCVEEERATSVQQEIVLSDDSPPESTASFNGNYGTGEEGTESSADSPCFDGVDQRELQEPLKSVEIKEGRLENDSVTSESEEDIVEVDEDGISETSENSSEVKGRTSMDSSEAAIWPAELIEEEPQRDKGDTIDDQIEAKGTAKSNSISPTYDQSHSGAGADVSECSGYASVMASAKGNSSEKPTLYAALNYCLSVNKFRTSAILMLLFAIMLLVLLTHRNRISGSSTMAIL